MEIVLDIWIKNNTYHFKILRQTYPLKRNQFAQRQFNGCYSKCKNRRVDDSNGIRTHDDLVRQGTLNHLTIQASLAKQLSVCLRTKWLWVRILLLLFKLQIWDLLRAGSSLTFRQTAECRFTLKLMWHDNNIQSLSTFESWQLVLNWQRSDEYSDRSEGKSHSIFAYWS